MVSWAWNRVKPGLVTGFTVYSWYISKLEEAALIFFGR